MEKKCYHCIHINVCALKAAVETNKLVTFFGSYTDIQIKLASICKEYKTYADFQPVAEG